jgi:hypothetical protein
MRSFRAAHIAVSLALSGVCAVAQAQTPARIVTLSPAEVGRLGIRTVPVKAASYTPRDRGYGVVVDLGALATVEAGVSTARAATQQSQADVKRSRALFAQDMAVSHQALDAAESKAATDQAALLLAQRQEVAQYGVDAPWRGSHPDHSALAQLTSGKAVLVRATFPLDAFTGSHPSAISVTHLSAQQDQAGWPARKIWAAPADPTIPGRSFFALISGSDLQTGEHVLVFAPTGPTVEGMRIPADAIVLSDEKTWCYLQLAPGQFRRLPIEIGRPLSGGYFVPQKPIAGQSVVLKGAGLLLARELGAAALPRE